MVKRATSRTHGFRNRSAFRRLKRPGIRADGVILDGGKFGERKSAGVNEGKRKEELHRGHRGKGTENTEKREFRQGGRMEMD